MNETYYREKWERTCGYTLGIDHFGSWDVIEARKRYGFEMDGDLSHYIQSSMKVLGEEDFWCAVVAPKFSIFKGDWKDYIEKGIEQRDLGLVQTVSDQEAPLEKRQASIDRLREVNSPFFPPVKAERIPASRIERRYEVKSPETTETTNDPLSWMDNEEDFWGFNKQEENEVENLDPTLEQNLPICPIGHKVVDSSEQLHQEDLYELENQYQENLKMIQANLRYFMAVGFALQNIRDKRLYRNHYDTFEECVYREFGLKVRHAYRQIDAYETASILSEDNRPLVESQARALTPLAKEDPDMAVEAWQSVTDKAAEEGRKVTAKDVKEEVDRHMPKPEEYIQSAKRLEKFEVTMNTGKKRTVSREYLADNGYTDEQTDELEG